MTPFFHTSMHDLKGLGTCPHNIFVNSDTEAILRTLASRWNKESLYVLR